MIPEVSNENFILLYNQYDAEFVEYDPDDNTSEPLQEKMYSSTASKISVVHIIHPDTVTIMASLKKITAVEKDTIKIYRDGAIDSYKSK